MKISDFWALYDKFGWFAVILAIVYLIYGFFVWGIGTEGIHRERWRGWLANDSLGQGYRRFLIGGLYKLASWIGDQDRLFPHVYPQPKEAIQLPTKQSSKTHRHGIINKLFHTSMSPWTQKSFFFCLRMALIYPIIALLLGWFFGATGNLGDIIFLPSTSIFRRLLFMLLISIMSYSFYQSMNKSGWRFLQWYFAGTVALAIAGALGGPFGFVGAFAFGSAFAVAGAFAVVAAVAVVATVAGAAANTWIFGTTILFFMTILPLLNGPLDWLSLGLTRGLLQAIGEKRHKGARALGWAFLDLIVALLLMVAVSVILVAGIGVFNLATLKLFGRSAVDLPQILAALRANPWSIDQLWVYFMVFSTLLPTLLHAFIALMALISWLPSQYRHWMTDPEYFIKDRDRRLTTKFWFLIVPPVSFIIAPALFVYGLYWLLSWHGDLLGLGILNMLDGIAGLFA